MKNAHPRQPAPRRRRLSWPTWLLISLLLLGLGVVYKPRILDTHHWTREQAFGIDRHLLRETLGAKIIENKYPKKISIVREPSAYEASVEYTIDHELQNAVETIFEQYGPDYGVFTALNPDTGEILALVNHRRESVATQNLALQATYPAASVFKIVTASAAMDLDKVTPKTVIPFNGKTTSLYRKNVLEHKNNQWTRRYTLTESFAKSVNTVFARLGIYTIGAEPLTGYGEAFGFNRELDADFKLAPSTLKIDPEDNWSIAEVASGYTRSTTLSPVHAAAIAATAINGGHLIRPSLVRQIIAKDGLAVYVQQNQQQPVISTQTANDLRTLMQTTVSKGSAKSSFKKFFRGDMKDIEVGGKTGSLTGKNPAGRYDWFVGYAQKDGRKLAFAVMCINKEFWYVKSAYVARKAIEHFFGQP